MTPETPYRSAILDAPTASAAPTSASKSDDVPVIPKFIPVLPEQNVKLVGRDGNITQSSKNPVLRAYRLHPDIVAALATLADKGCYKCLSTGIKDWRAKGLKARVCPCVLAKQERAKEFHDRILPDPGSVA